MSWPPFESEADWEDFVRRFEAGAPTKEEWTHGAHMCVGAWFVSRFSLEEAGWRIRSGMRRLNECLGGAEHRSERVSRDADGVLDSRDPGAFR